MNKQLKHLKTIKDNHYLLKDSIKELIDMEVDKHALKQYKILSLIINDHMELLKSCIVINENEKTSKERKW